MGKQRFVDYKKVEEVLINNGFFGMTCKRDDGRLTYTYESIHSHCVKVSVVVAKLQPNEIKSDKIVLNINVNGRNLDGWDDFINAMKNKWKIHNKEFQKTFKIIGNDKKNKHAGNSR